MGSFFRFIALCQDLLDTMLFFHGTFLFFLPTCPDSSLLSVISENAVVPGDVLFPDSVLTLLQIYSATGSN